ncbi:HAD family hydrolase [Nocardiopsis composta]|uniref:Beta-phosphoglucomutase family hydrolase n=1 Tax=Nocardiopsis composta TaxID=157465 RepID=A0A7W8QIJ7_9ACTN|nr:HAD-IA family hydrolase [Nocardiopsis composta]MBB5431147.1 beta-phosphoglucomutase family hydrolase [Nocardiopsis composta]
MLPGEAVIPLDEIEAVVFDVDGVVTDTTPVHAAAWKQTFDAFLRSRAGPGSAFRPFRLREDYLEFVDGKARLDGVRAFLTSRGISLPDDPPRPGDATPASLGESKDRRFLEQLRRYGASAFPSTAALIRRLRRAGVATAAVSASRNCAAVLRAAGVEGLFDARVDGVEAGRLGLPGKPDPAVFLEAARRLGAPPERTAVLEDSLAGVEAAARGGFGLVVGVDRGGQEAELYRRGAHTVVADPGDLEITGAYR